MTPQAAATLNFQTLYRRDRTLLAVTMLAPYALRPQLQALACLYHELQDIPGRTTEPLMAEIRREWWRERLAGEGAGTMQDSPILTGLETTKTAGLTLIAETNLETLLKQFSTIVPSKHKRFHRAVRYYNKSPQVKLHKLLFGYFSVF